jgi:hypothetical protein
MTGLKQYKYFLFASADGVGPEAIKHKKNVLLHARMSSCRALRSFMSAARGEEEKMHVCPKENNPDSGGRATGLAFAAESVRVCSRQDKCHTQHQVALVHHHFQVLAPKCAPAPWAMGLMDILIFCS